MPAWIVSMIISVIMSALSYMISARKKASQSQMSPGTIDSPTVSMNRAIPVVFGRVRVKSPNVAWMGGQSTQEVRS